MTKLNPQVFRDAAEKVVSKTEGFACAALESLAGECAIPDYLDFLSVHFKPETLRADDSWWGLPWEYEEREARILALLFCAEMCKR